MEDNFDYQSAATDIIAMLNALGLQDRAQKIADAILRSSDHTEALITLRHTLKDLVENQLLPTEVVEKARLLIRELTGMIDPK